MMAGLIVTGRFHSVSAHSRVKTGSTTTCCQKITATGEMRLTRILLIMIWMAREMELNRTSTSPRGVEGPPASS